MGRRKEYHKWANKKYKREQEEKIEKLEKLTPKQELFCQYYLKNFNATLSYAKVYGCDYNSALASGPRLLGDVRIKKEIERLKEIKKNSIMLDKNDIVERRMKIAFSDMTDFVEWGQEEINVMGRFGPVEIKNPITGEKEILKEKTNVVKFIDSNLVDGGLISEIKTGKDTSIKLEDRQKALDWLSKYFLMNPLDKHKIEFDKLTRQDKLKETEHKQKLDNKKFEQDKQVHADKMAMEEKKINNDTGLKPVVIVDNIAAYLEEQEKNNTDG